MIILKLFEKREEGFLFNHLNEDEIKNDLKIVNLDTCFQIEKHIAFAPYYMNAEYTVEVNFNFLFNYTLNWWIK